LSAVAHDTTLAGNGATTSPLTIADGGVTGPKIAAGQVVKSLNGLFDIVSLTAGSNVTITPSGNSLSIAAPNALGSVAHNATLAGNGASASPLGIANGGVTGANIASGQVVKGLNGLFDNVNLSAGSNITITPSGNGLSIAAPNLLGAVESNGTLTGNGTSAAPLGVNIPALNLWSAVAHNSTLTGNGASAALGVALPLILNAPSEDDALIATGGNSIFGGGGGRGVVATGGDVLGFGLNSPLPGEGVVATGGNTVKFGSKGAAGVRAQGGSGDFGGIGVIANGHRAIRSGHRREQDQRQSLHDQDRPSRRGSLVAGDWHPSGRLCEQTPDPGRGGEARTRTRLLPSPEGLRPARGEIARMGAQPRIDAEIRNQRKNAEAMRREK
jgi:hypothetical protein